MTGFHSDSSRVKVSESHVPDRLLQRFRQKWLASVVGVCAFCCCCVFCFIHFLMIQLVCCNAIAVFSVSLLQSGINMFQSVLPTRTARTAHSSARAPPTRSPATMSTGHAPVRQAGKARAARLTSTNA